MIYEKEANFPYPLLVNNTDDYVKSQFDLQVVPSVSQNEYIFTVEYELGSSFLRRMLKEKKAKLVLIIKAKDNKFIDVPSSGEIRIPRTHLSLDTRSMLQLMIRTEKEISFEENEDLNSFYNAFRRQIKVEPGQVLGFSNVVVYSGEKQRPFDLFEKRLDPTIKSDIKITLERGMIVITYRSQEVQFSQMSPAISRNLNNPYLYTGLVKALTNFVIHNTKNPEDSIEIENFGGTGDLDPLDVKLLTLMQEKKVEEISLSNIDEVIDAITDNILRKYTQTVRRLQDAG